MTAVLIKTPDDPAEFMMKADGMWKLRIQIVFGFRF